MEKRPVINFKGEFLAGVTTFLSMAYVLALYPNVMSQIGLPAGGTMVAVAVASAIGTFCMGCFAKYPFALAPGVGIIPFFAFSIVIAMKISWQLAMMAVFVEGLIFIALSATSLREKLFDIIPLPLKIAIAVGIGFFLIFIALQGAKIIVDGPCLTSLVSFRKNFGVSGICALLAIIGTMITEWLYHRNITGALLWGILITWGMGILCQYTGIYVVNPAEKMFSLYPSIDLHSCKQAFRDFGSLCGQCLNVSQWHAAESGFSGWKLLFSIDFAVIVFTMLISDIFDTIGTLAGLATASGTLDKKGKMPRVNAALMADAVATSAGALIGVTTTTTYVESAAGVMAGGKTQWTAYFIAALFLLSAIFAPIFSAIPAFALTPALLIVGFCMVSQITKIHFDDIPEAFPCLITIIMMPFAYSIADGIFFGIVFWTVSNLLCRHKERVNGFLIVLSILFVLKYIFL